MSTVSEQDVVVSEQDGIVSEQDVIVVVNNKMEALPIEDTTVTSTGGGDNAVVSEQRSSEDIRIERLERENQGLRRSEADKVKRVRTAEERLHAAEREANEAKISSRQLIAVNAYLCKHAAALENALRRCGIDPTFVNDRNSRVTAELRGKAMTVASERALLSAEETSTLTGGKARRKNKPRRRGKSENEAGAIEVDGDILDEENPVRRKKHWRLQRRREANRADVLLVTDCYSRANLKPRGGPPILKVKPLRCGRNLFDALTYISHSRDWQPLRCVIYVVGANDLCLATKSVEASASDAASLVESTRSMMPSTYVLFCSVSTRQPRNAPPTQDGETPPELVSDAQFAERAAQFNKSMHTLCEASPMLFFVECDVDATEDADAAGKLLLDSVAGVYMPILECSNGKQTSPTPPSVVSLDGAVENDEAGVSSA